MSVSYHDSSKRCDFVIQNDYSLWGRDPGPGVLPVCEALGNWLCAVESVRYGLSDWKVTPTTKFPEGDLREMFLRFPPGAMKADWSIVELLATLGKEKNATPGKIALAWLMAKKTFDVSMIGDDFLQNVRFRVNVLRYSF